MRRDFSLLPDDEAFLVDYGLPYETINENGQWVLIHEFPTHGGYNHPTATIAIRLATGYPNAQLDMVFVCPPLARADGRPIGATGSKKTIAGKVYQRWSRHRTPANPWKPGTDDLGTHIHLIEDWFTREFD